MSNPERAKNKSTAVPPIVLPNLNNGSVSTG